MLLAQYGVTQIPTSFRAMGGIRAWVGFDKALISMGPIWPVAAYVAWAMGSAQFGPVMGFTGLRVILKG